MNMFGLGGPPTGPNPFLQGMGHPMAGGFPGQGAPVAGAFPGLGQGPMMGGFPGQGAPQGQMNPFLMAQMFHQPQAQPQLPVQAQPAPPMMLQQPQMPGTAFGGATGPIPPRTPLSPGAPTGQVDDRLHNMLLQLDALGARMQPYSLNNRQRQGF